MLLPIILYNKINGILGKNKDKCDVMTLLVGRFIILRIFIKSLGFKIAFK